MTGVKVNQVLGMHPKAQANRDNPSGGGASNQIEVVGNPNLKVLFNMSEHGSGKEATNAAAIERQNSELSFPACDFKV